MDEHFIMISPAERRSIQEHYAAVTSPYAKFEGTRSRLHVGPLLDELPIDQANRILDIGTGPGPVIESLRARLQPR